MESLALTKPILRDIVAFDATNAQVFTFNVIGGNQVVKNRLIVRKNETNEIVYDETITTFEFAHTLPGEKLENGVYYNAAIQTFNNMNESSPLSNQIQFYCYETPTISFTNLPVGNIIESSSFTFNATYEQAEGELLNSYTFFLYNIQGIQVATSGEIFVNSPTPPPTSMSREFVGFDDGSVYYIECRGTTVYGTGITTGRVQVFIQYEKPNLFAIVQIENNKCDGYISIRSNMVSIEGESNPSPPVFINDSSVDLRENGSWVRWTRGYSASGDFTFRLWGRDFKANDEISKLWNESDTEEVPNHISIFFREEYLANDDTRYAYFDATVFSGTNIPYYIYSNRIVYPDSTENIQMWLRRINNVYEIKLGNYTPE